jgi:hypothetical protein
VLRRANAFLHWLDEQDRVREPQVEIRKPISVTQCAAASANYTRCLLASGHQGEHRNSHEGEYWDDKPVAVTHFYTGLDSAYAPCGEFMRNETPVSASLDVVTCERCKEALGL